MKVRTSNKSIIISKMRVTSRSSTFSDSKSAASPGPRKPKVYFRKKFRKMEGPRAGSGTGQLVSLEK